VAFALALVGRPRFLFLDEPTEGLDIEARREFWEALGRWTDEYGTTLCFTTHDLSEADQYARRVVVLNRGRLAADGAPETLKSRLGQTRVRFTAEADWSASRLSDHLGAFSVNPIPRPARV
jgi:ABC-2 type transport system ATP-binding protein